jgi:Zn-dependent protease
MLFLKDPMLFILFLPIMLFSLSFHECAHAAVAYWRGDDTASLMGRITLNPLKHIDPIGLIAFFIIGLGWAKPVPINPNRMKNIRRDPALVGLSGPLSNIFLCAVFALGLRLLWGPIENSEPSMRDILLKFFIIGAWLNAALAFFNLLPVPPLDGSHLLAAYLPNWALEKYEMFARYGLFLILLLLLVGGLFGMLIGIPSSALLRLFWGDELSRQIFSNFKWFGGG